MQTNIISSTDNKKIKKLLSVKNDSEFRKNEKLCFLEGEKLIFDTPKNLISEIYIKNGYKNENLNKYDNIKIYILDDKIFNKIKSTENSQGIIAIANFNNIIKIDKIGSDVLCLESVRDPGNIGTIIRTAEASGFRYIILSKDCCDITSPKVIRSSMSSFFRINFFISDNLINDLLILKNNDFKIITTAIGDYKKYYEIDYNQKSIYIFGNEARGVSDEIKKISDDLITIPMDGEIDSLNVAISISVICFNIKKEKYEIKK